VVQTLSEVGPDRGPTVRVIDRLEEFEAMEDAWDDLVVRSRGTPFMVNAYLAQQWREEPGTSHCLVAERDGRLVGGLPVCARRRRYNCAGSILGAPHRSDLLCDPDEDEATALQVLDGLRQTSIDWLPVKGVPPRSNLAAALPARALHVQPTRLFWLEMPDGWDAVYEEKTSSKGRSEDRRKLRRLGELGEVSFQVATDGPELQRALGDAFEIYRRRWRDRPGEAGGFSTDETSWRQAAQRMGARGYVQLVTLRIDDVAVAFAYSFLFGGTLWGHRLAFDPQLEHHSPGWLTVLHAIGAASAAGARRVDFGIGDAAYKERLATGSTHLLWGTVMHRGLGGTVAARASEVRYATRQRLKRSRVVANARAGLFRVRRGLAPHGTPVARG
jgi:CelD/BcsL family acetyltransferase involved in cellulose biosynthesis